MKLPHPKNRLVALLLAAFVWTLLVPAGWSKDTDEMGAERLQQLLKSNPAMDCETVTLMAIKELRKKKASRRGAAREGLKITHERSPAHLKTASLQIMEADAQLAPWVIQTAGGLDRSLNQDLLVAALKAKPDVLAFAVQVACDNDPTHFRELALAAQSAVPGKDLEILAGLMASRCQVSQALCWHFHELKKRKVINLVSVLDEAMAWEAQARKMAPGGR